MNNDDITTKQMSSVIFFNYYFFLILRRHYSDFMDGKIRNRDTMAGMRSVRHSVSVLGQQFRSPEYQKESPIVIDK